ncbi:MAG: SPOR domain-containing protein [Candidatus Zixiibacteriota bacterium]
MIRYCLRLVCTILAAASVSQAKDIYELIQGGHIDEAREQLSKLSSASQRNGDNLFLQSLLEPDAEKSAGLSRAALNAAVSPQYEQEVVFRLAQYSAARGNYTKLGELAGDYRRRWEDGKYLSDMLRYAALSLEKQDRRSQAVANIERHARYFPNGDKAQYGFIDMARIQLSKGRSDRASKTLIELSRRKEGPGVSQALYLLTMQEARRKNLDRAVFYFNLLREGYPFAVGISSLVDRLSDLSSSAEPDLAAERRTGTFYSVQVGVFSKKGNAKKWADLFKKAYEHRVDIGSKTISEKKYHVVFVGRLASYAEASQLKLKLEINHDQTFQVVAR